MNYLRDFIEGCKHGVEFNYQACNGKVPMWACWVMGIALSPVGIITIIICLIKGKLNDYIEWMEDNIN